MYSSNLKQKRAFPIAAALLIAVVASALLLAACGGGGDEATTSPTAAGETPAGSDGEQTDEPTGEPTGEPADAAALLDELISGYPMVEGAITYTVTGFELELTSIRVVDKGNSSRTEYTDSTGMAIVIRTAAHDDYYCWVSDGTCQHYADVPQVADLSSVVRGFLSSGLTFATASVGSGSDIDTSSEEIAGVDATCFSYTYETQEGDWPGEGCFSEDGLLVRLTFGPRGEAGRFRGDRSQLRSLRLGVRAAIPGHGAVAPRTHE